MYHIKKVKVCFNILRTYVHSISYDAFKLKKVCGLWIPCIQLNLSSDGCSCQDLEISKDSTPVPQNMPMILKHM